MIRHKPHLEFMAIGAHADDVELGCGGSIAKMLAAGKKGLIVDLTLATAATRGTAEDRLAEAQRAAQELGDVERVNLQMKDAELQISEEYLRKLILLIREHRPRIIITHGPSDYHPDHNVTHELVKQAWYKAGLKMLYPDMAPYRAHRLIYFIGAYLTEPDFAIDITDFYPQKQRSIQAYASQFKVAGSESFKGNTYLSSPEFLENLEVRHRSLGQKILKKYAEGFTMEQTPEMASLSNLTGETY